MNLFKRKINTESLTPLEEYFKLPLIRQLMGIFFIALGAGTIYITPYMLYTFKSQLVQIMNVQESNFAILLTVYGVVNTIFYIPGGWLADRMSTKSLFTISMIGTGIVTIWYSLIGIQGANIDFNQLIIIHILFSFTTVLTFWSAFVKGVKLLGPPSEQSKLYSATETTRYSLQLATSFISVALSAIFVVSPIFVQLTIGGNQISGSSMFIVLIVYAAIYVLTGILCLFLLPGKFRIKRNAFYNNRYQYLNIQNKVIDFATKAELIAYKKNQRVEFFKKIGQDSIKALKNVDVWLIAFLIFFVMNCYAFIAYYGSNVLKSQQWTDPTILSALSTTWTYGMPILGTLSIAFLVKFKFKKTARALMYVSALLVVFSFVLFMLGLLTVSSWTMGLVFLIFMCLSFFAIGAARSIYWVPMTETKIPVSIFGIAIGIISIVGFLKDVWVSPVLEEIFAFGGYEGNTGIFNNLGLSILFGFLLANAILAFITSIFIFRRVIKNKKKLVKEAFNFSEKDL
ncbi:MFS transporter [Candidatus Mycoplasma pogonae]